MNAGIQRGFLHSENKFITILEDGQSKEVFTDEEMLELHRRYKDPGVLLRTMHVGTEAQSLQSCPTLWDPLDCSLPGSSVHGILQARILEWVAMPSYRGSSQPRDQTHVSYAGRRVLYH